MREYAFDDNNDHESHREYTRPSRGRKQNRSVRRGKWAIWGFIALLLCVILFQSAQVLIRLQSAYQHGEQFAQLVRGDLTPESYTIAAAALEKSAAAVADAEAAFGPFVPVLRGLQWLPGIGQDLAALPILFDAGQQLSEVAVTGFAIAQPILLNSQDRSPLAQLPAVYAAAEPELTALRGQVDAVDRQLATIEIATLSPLLREPIQQLQAAVGLIAPGLRMSEYLPEILGVNEPRTYLVLAQNNHELRATGGFLTAVGRVSLLDGRVVGIEFVDSYDRTISRVDLPLPQAPAPVREHMNIEVMLLRDANWSPDFPTTAQIARTIYNQQTGRTVDGIIALDLHAVEMFVSALEPLTIAGAEEPLTGASVLQQLTAFWAAPIESEATLASGDAQWWSQRKDFIPKLAEAAVSRIQRGQFDYLRMLSTVQNTLDTRAVQLWFANPALAETVAEIGWDGALQPPRTGDFLAVVNTNFGYNKVNAVIEDSVAYQVDWPDGPAAPAVATLTVLYRHPYERANYVCDQTPHYEGSYEEMMVRCYFDYVRVYAPPGSELLGIDGLQPETVISQRGEGGSQLFAGYFVLSPGTQHTVTFQYRLPARITPENYTLTVRRQAGTNPLPLQAQIGSDRSIATTIESGLFTWP